MVCFECAMQIQLLQNFVRVDTVATTLTCLAGGGFTQRAGVALASHASVSAALVCVQLALLAVRAKFPCSVTRYKPKFESNLNIPHE